MFCPVCESEYEAGITHCPDDNVPLVERLDPEVSHDNSEAKFVVLHNVGLSPEAEMINDMLRENGIRSFVRSGSSDALSPLLSASSLGAAVMVDERDYDRAQELYSSVFGDDVTPLTGGTDDEDDQETEEDED